MNQSGALYFARCSMTLNEDTAKEIKKLTKEEARVSGECETLYEMIQRDLMNEEVLSN